MNKNSDDLSDYEKEFDEVNLKQEGPLYFRATKMGIKPPSTEEELSIFFLKC